MSYCCYLLRSSTSRRTYVGITNNLPRRLRQHNGELVGGAKSTRAGRPWQVAAFVEGFEDMSQALMFEWAWRRSKPRGGYLTGRRRKLREVLNRERWTARAPVAAGIPLRVHWLPDVGGAELGPPLAAHVEEVAEGEGGVAAWAATAKANSSAAKGAHVGVTDVADQELHEEEQEGKEQHEEEEAVTPAAEEQAAEKKAPAPGSSERAWLDAEIEWEALEAQLEAQGQASAALSRPLPAKSASENRPSDVRLPSDNGVGDIVLVNDARGAATDLDPGQPPATSTKSKRVRARKTSPSRRRRRLGKA